MNLQLGRAVNIVFQTTPYLVYRALVYGVICAVLAVALLFLAIVGRIFGSGAAGVLFALLAVAGGFGVQLLREYVLYLLKAGHIALVTEIVTQGHLPAGINQTQWAKERVMHYFKEISVLALIDQLVKGVTQTLNRTLFDVMTFLPIPGLEGAAKIVQRIVDFSLTYIDESIIAYTFKTGNENVFDAAKTAIVLYCQSWKGLLKNAVALTVLSYAFVAVTALIFLIPLGAVALMLPDSWSMAKFLLFVLALFAGFSAKWILFDPIACTATLLTFLSESEALTPDPEWEARIESVSAKFCELKKKAIEKFRGATSSGDAAPKPE